MPEHPPFSVVAGLGNPGLRYADTRHNAGFRFVERLAERYRAEFKSSSRFSGEVALLRHDSRTLRLLKPGTFMNHSGRALSALSHYFRVPAAGILVAHDEIDLPPGTVRLKRGGGHGGHNGLRDVVPQLAGSEFSRIRIGVGHPGSKDRVVGHVLDRPSVAERSAIDDAIDRVLGEIARIASGDLEGAMNTLHRRIEPADEE